MSCEHKRIKCVNCEFICIDCGEKVTAPQKEPEKPKRRARKGVKE